MKKGALLVVLAVVFLVAALVAAGGCQTVTEGEPVHTDPFELTWNLSDEQRTVELSGNSAGHEAGRSSDFELALKNNSDSNWQDEYCIFMVDTERVVLEIAHDSFDVSPAGSFCTTIPVTFPADLNGPYGIYVLIPDQGSSVSTIWIGRKTNVSAGPWPYIDACPRYFAGEETASRLAEEFVRNSPTFVFDGVKDSLNLAETLYPDIENAWQFIFQFDSRHAGYGDRTGQRLAQLVTPHKVEIAVENGEIKSAIIDGQWDMANQKLINGDTN